MCILLGIGGQYDKVHLKNIKLFRIIPKKKISLFFFKNLGGGGVGGGGKAPLGPVDHPPLWRASWLGSLVTIDHD